MVPQLSWYLALSAVLFTIGVVGVMIKRNVISMFMCIELMLNAVNLTFVAFSSFFRDVTGQLFVFIVMTVAAAEAAVGLGIIIYISSFGPLADPLLPFLWDMLVTVLFSFAIFYWAMQVCLPEEEIEEMMREVVLPEEEGLEMPAH